MAQECKGSGLEEVPSRCDLNYYFLWMSYRDCTPPKLYKCFKCTHQFLNVTCIAEQPCILCNLYLLNIIPQQKHHINALYTARMWHVVCVTHSLCIALNYPKISKTLEALYSMVLNRNSSFLKPLSL